VVVGRGESWKGEANGFSWNAKFEETGRMKKKLASSYNKG